MPSCCNAAARSARTRPAPTTPQQASYYDTAPLRETLLRLVDFDCVNRHYIRLSLGTVHVGAGQSRYFDSLFQLEIVHLSYSAKPWETATRDADFSAAAIRERWDQGYRDAAQVVERAAWLAPVPPGVGVVVHEPHRQAPDGQATARHADAPVPGGERT